MARDLQEDLGLYEAAYLLGGADRVALVALVGLCLDGRIEITTTRHRVSAVRREPDGPVQAAALEEIPRTGRPLGPVRWALARSDPVAAVRTALVVRGLLSRWTRRRTAQGRGAAVLLRDRAEPAGPLKVAIHGTDGIGDGRLHRVFTTPDPAPPDPPPKRRRGPYRTSGGDTPGLERYAGDGYRALEGDGHSGGDSSY